MSRIKILVSVCIAFFSMYMQAQPNWPAIKSNATFIVYDSTYNTPYIQPIHVSGWEDGLFMTRDGLHIYSTYLPLDALSWIIDLQANPACFNFDPYYRGPLLGIDTVTNIFGCANYMHSDITIASRATTVQPLNPWSSSNLQTPFSFEGGAHGVLLNPDTFDVFVFTKDGPGTQSTDIMLMRHVPVNPATVTAVPILSTPAQEDNPHIERINDSTLVLLFDRSRYMYYSLSMDNGYTWQPPVLITNVLNDQAPYDVQPHLWNDGTDWWVYFCANNTNGVRGIYKSKQLVANNWDSWGPKQVIIEPGPVTGGSGTVFGIGEPTLTQWGDLSFVVVYGKTGLADTTDVYDCDPWFMPKKRYVATGMNASQNGYQLSWSLSPNPAGETISVSGLMPDEPMDILFYSAEGKMVKRVKALGKINIADLPDGFYTARTSDMRYAPLKLVKK